MSRHFEYATFDAAALSSAFGLGLKTVRKEKGYRQAYLQRITGITDAAISHIENGRQNSSLVTAIVLAQAIGSTVDELLSIGLEEKKCQDQNGARR